MADSSRCSALRRSYPSRQPQRKRRAVRPKNEIQNETKELENIPGVINNLKQNDESEMR